MTDALAAYRRTVAKLRDGEPLKLVLGSVPEETRIDLTEAYAASLRQTLLDALEAELPPTDPEPEPAGSALAIPAERTA